MNKKVSMAKPRSVQAADKWVAQKPAAVTDEPMKRLTVDVPESLHTEIKVVCAHRKLKMNALVMDGLRRALDHYKHEAA